MIFDEFLIFLDSFDDFDWSFDEFQENYSFYWMCDLNYFEFDAEVSCI